MDVTILFGLYGILVISTIIVLEWNHGRHPDSESS